MNTTYAYLAGVIDSDGYITIHRSSRNRKSGAASWSVDYYSPRIGISGTRRAPHDLASATFGGRVSGYAPKNPAHRLTYHWSAWGQQAAAALRQIRPYLLVKGEQADLVVELAELIALQFAEVKATTKPPYKIPSDMLAERTRLWRDVAALNEPRNRRVHLDTTAG